jgi:hypothetical protein
VACALLPRMKVAHDMIANDCFRRIVDV